MQRGVSKRQKELLNIIYLYIKDSGYPPTYEDMREKLKVASNQTIIDLLKILESKKLLKRDEGEARGLAILPLGYEALSKPPLVRMAGVTAAGPAIEAIPQREWVEMPSGYKKYDKVFIVEVSGNSMIEANIYDGDQVLIRESEEYKSGDIVLARIGDEVTLKTFVFDNGRTYLKPENPACRIIPITHDTYFLGKYLSNLGKAPRETQKKLIETVTDKEIHENYETKIDDIDLSFASVREYERTKHVHRLHPYLGKFIPQLVDVFLKKYFKKGDAILDPFMGSGTTLVEANVLGMHSVGVEISHFNCLIAEIKTKEYNITLAEKEIKDILAKTKEFSKTLGNDPIEKVFNSDSKYLNTWLSDRALQEILFYRNEIKNYQNQDLLKIILSRATRSARLITHYDLARPSKPVREPYYCIKHRRMCQPINEAFKFIDRYSIDTVNRIKEFDRLRTNAHIKIVQGDSREVDFSKIAGYKGGKFDGIFTSPPYVGLIDYHDQHRYAYELFGFDDNGFKEIGPASKGKSRQAKEDYKKVITDVFKNVNMYLKKGAKIFVVVNDRDNLYPDIAKECGYTVEKIYHRPVLMRTERDNTKFSESIYYFRKLQ